MTWYALAVFISEKSDLRNLSFRPQKKAMELVRFEFKEVVLNQAPEEAILVDLSDQELSRVLWEVFGKISFSEFCQLIAAIKSEGTLWSHLNIEDYSQKMEFLWNERLENLIALLAQTPKTFLNWATAKQMSNRDLQPLLAIKSLSEINPLLTFFSDQQLSRNEGKQALDILVDLLLMKKSFEELSPNGKDSWVNQLYKMRYPTASERDLSPARNPWPKYVQVVKARQGDRVLQKMQITYSDLGDLTKKLGHLQKMEPQA